MKKFLLIVVSVLSLALAAAAAGNFWQTKKFADWSEKEVQKMLQNSPWARGVEIRLSSATGGGMGGGSRRGGGLGDDTAAGSDEPASGGRSRAGRGIEMAPPPPAILVYVRWQSALPVRQAIAKARYGAEAASSPEAAQLLNAQPDRYIVAIDGVPPRLLRGELAKLKSKAFLRIKKQPDIVAVDVRGAQAGELINLYVFFPRGQENTHVVTLEDKEVEFAVDLGRVVVKRKFKLKDMVYGDKLEI